MMLVPRNSQMEKEIVASFENEGFEEVDMDIKETESFPFQFKLKGRDSIISEVYFIVPKHDYK